MELNNALDVGADGTVVAWKDGTPMCLPCACLMGSTTHGSLHTRDNGAVNIAFQRDPLACSIAKRCDTTAFRSKMHNVDHLFLFHAAS